MKHESNLNKITMWLIVVSLAVVLFNSYQVGKLKEGASAGGPSISVAGSGNDGVLPDVIPKGVPKIYGKELGVSYDDVSASNLQSAEAAIGRLGNLDNSITLEGENLRRYIKIVSQISCEYCCGAQSIIFSSGQPACGCAHSYAMRGLAKHLIKNHGAEYTDDEILEELGKWKTLFFPGKLGVKAKVLQDRGIELNYINLASNKYRGVENEAVSGGSGSGMVGGC